MQNELMEIQDLHVVYETEEGTIFAVSGLNLTMRPGETLGLVGETGAGKTTTALSVMRLLPKGIGFIKHGRIVLDGVDITGATEADMRLLRGGTVSMIFQDPMTSLNPIMTVGDQISEVLELHKEALSKDERSARVDQLLELVGIPCERKSDYPHQFSGGMKQRVVIAIALACEPKLILADEPTTALDVTIQAQVLKLIAELKMRLNTAMLLITHDLGIVAETCDRVAVMYAGEVVEVGTARDLFEGELHHPYTEGLFGSIPDIDKDSRRLNPIEGLMPDPANLPSGCRFHPRCPRALDICKSVSPRLISRDSHHVKCHLYDNTPPISGGNAI